MPTYYNHALVTPHFSLDEALHALTNAFQCYYVNFIIGYVFS